MPEKDQIFIFTKDELALIKKTFANNDAFVYTIRKVLLQFPLTDAEKGYLKEHLNTPVMKILKKRILPEASNEFPLNSMPSILSTLVEAFRTKQDEEMFLQFEAKKLEIDYLTQQMAVLENLDAEQPIKWEDMGVIVSKPREDFINISAYLFIQTYVDQMLNYIKVLAGDKDETPEEQQKRLTQNSSK